ncbi:MAG TPA: family 20 glycosylhydrolase [Opitutaceae bacterium]
MIRAFQWDLARQVERLDWLIAQLPRYADWGYQELYLHLEDAVEYPSVPGVARADAYSYRNFEKLVAAATRAGIGVVPIVNLLGHTQYLVKMPELRDLNELRAPDGRPLEKGQICPLHPRTLEIAEKLLRDMAPFCTTGKVHVGLDESFHLGKHPLSRAEVERSGLPAHFAGYVQRLHGLTKSLDLRLGLWADMLALIPEAISQLPRGIVAYDWYYYPFRRHPRMELYNFAEYDLAPALRAQGIEYWGCPMNGAFRYEPLPLFGDRLGNIQSWWRRCQRTGAGGFLVTSWESYRLAIEMTTVVDAAAASLWLNPEADDHVSMLAKGFERVFGRSGARRAARAALACDQYPFAGYARWEINDRWDVCATPEGPAPYEKERRFFSRVSRQPLPEPFAASVAFRRYLAERDVFVRRAAQGVFRLRRALADAAPAPEAQAGGGLRAISRERGPLARKMKAGGAPALPIARERAPATTASQLDGVCRLLTELRAEAAALAQALRAGRAAARRMWARTRDRGVRGQNETILDMDTRRLGAWRHWLARCSKNPELALAATPVCGEWQLQFTVHNFAPALQRVIVESQQSDGTWRQLHARYTIEFQALAAMPRTRIKRELSLPLTGADASLRITLRGLGQVAISRVRLTDGHTALRARGWPHRHKKVLGKPAPSHGLPDLASECNASHLPLVFRG